MNKKMKNEMVKSYYECLNEISQEELFEGLLGYGLFAEKIPNFLSSAEFLSFCKQKNLEFKQKNFRYIRYENIRNINIPRILSIPNPLAYYKHCGVLKEHWKDIKEFFKAKTKNNKYKVSRIHIRKLEKNKKIFQSNYEYEYEGEMICQKLFEMNYKNYKIDGSPEQEIFINKHYKVKADISNCFPSIYTHVLGLLLEKKRLKKTEKNGIMNWIPQ